MVRWRKDKKGFSIPEKEWLRKELSVLIQAVFKKSVLHDNGVIDYNSFLRYYEDFRAGWGSHKIPLRLDERSLH